MGLLDMTILSNDKLQLWIDESKKIDGSLKTASGLIIESVYEDQDFNNLMNEFGINFKIIDREIIFHENGEEYTATVEYIQNRHSLNLVNETLIILNTLSRNEDIPF